MTPAVHEHIWWLASRASGLVALGLILLGVWVRVELASRAPLVDMRIMRLRGVWTVNLAGFLLGFGMYGSFILLPQFVEQPESTGYGFGASVTEAGLFMLPSTLGMLITGPMAGRLERRFGSKPPLISSTKSLTGHSLGAAGVQEAIYSILMLNNGFAAESAHIEELDPAFEDLPILRKREDRELNCVLSNSFGFGGTNASLAFTKVAA